MSGSYGFDVYGTALSLHPEAGDPQGQVAEMARRAGRYGFDGLLSFYNHKNLDPWAVAATILQTSDVTPLVALQPYALPPFTAAKLIHSFTSLHGRRLDLNLITGAAPEELAQVNESLAHDERYERAAEYLHVVRSLLTSDAPLVHRGTHYTFNALKTCTALPELLRPRIFVAGSSMASHGVARLADVHITHPEPVDTYVETMGAAREGGPRTGIRIGLVARDTEGEAWAAAREAYPADRLVRHKVALRGRSDSDWSRRMAQLATEDQIYDDVYWPGAYRADKGTMPLLVGSYASVAEYLGRYLDLGVSVLLLGGVQTEPDFMHAAQVIGRVRRTPAEADAETSDAPWRGEP